MFHSWHKFIKYWDVAIERWVGTGKKSNNQSAFETFSGEPAHSVCVCSNFQEKHHLSEQ